MGYTLEFKDLNGSLVGAFNMTPEAAVSFMRDKGLRKSFHYADMLAEEHVNAFTVAKMMDMDLLADVQKKVTEAIDSGMSMQEFRSQLTPYLQSKGWWGKATLTDPVTGKAQVVQLGSAHRLNTIFRTNVQSAYAVGEWGEIQHHAQDAPYLMYDAIDDYRTRPLHHHWDNTILPVSDKWWATHYPPNGYNCRCGVIQLSGDQLDSIGRKPAKHAPKDGTRLWKNPRNGVTYRIPNGIDPGFDYNVGQSRLEHLKQLFTEKVKALPGPMQQYAPAVDDLARHAWLKGQKAAEARLQTISPDAAALKELQGIEANNPPYLGAALKQVKATKAGKAMSPSELLDAAKAKAAKAEQSAALAHYKQAKIAGKQPGPAAQAAYDNLPDAAQADVQAAIESKTQAAAKEAAAAQKLADIKQNPAGQTLKTKALEKLTADGHLDGLSATEKLAKVEEVAAAQQAKASQAAALSGFKKKVLEGKIPTPAQKAALEALDPQAQAEFMAKLGHAKAEANAQTTWQELVDNHAAGDLVGDQKAAFEQTQKWIAAQKTKPSAIDTVKHYTDSVSALEKAPTPTPAKPKPKPKPKPSAHEGQVQSPDVEIHPDALTQIGPQKGSNPGGLFQDADTGVSWYLKHTTTDIARNEVLAGKLYEAAGIDVPELRYLDYKGQPSVASRWLEGLKKADPATLASKPGTREGFVVDAWLGNWDVAGATYDNLLLKGGRVVRVDVGGALRYRAQGGLKGASDWSGKVQEIKSLRNAATNPQAASVFADVTHDDMLAGARKVAAVTDDQIDRLVRRYGPADAKAAEKLAATLKARRADIIRQFPEVEKPPAAAPPPADAGARVTEAEAARISDSRQNGYAIRTDGDEVEDQNVLLWQQKGASGKAMTNADMKIRGGAAERLDNAVTRASGSPTVPRQKELDTSLIETIKGVATNGPKDGLRQKDMDRISKLLDLHAKARAELEAEIRAGHLKPKSLKNFDDNYGPWIDTMRGYFDTKAVGEKIVWNPSSPMHVDAKIAVPGDVKQSGVVWQLQTKSPYTEAQVQRAFATATGKAIRAGDATHYVADLGGGVRVHYFPSSNGSFALRNRLMVEVDGNDATAAEKVFSAMEKIGVNGSRASDLDMEEVYLRQIAYHRRDDKDLDRAIAGITDQPKRVQAMRDFLSQKIGRDITSLPHYDPKGQLEAFGHGYVRRFRPDLDTPEWDAFAKTHALWHGITGGGNLSDTLQRILDSGGKMAPTIDKLRRGILPRGMSPDADLDSGGASYFFTRIKSRSSKARGIWWKPDLLKRLDSISYDGDRFGRVTSGVQENRQVGPDEWARAAWNGDNETIFKGGLSLFDDILKIQTAGDAERQAVLKIFRDHGYDQWPDGRALEDVVK